MAISSLVFQNVKPPTKPHSRDLAVPANLLACHTEKTSLTELNRFIQCDVVNTFWKDYDVIDCLLYGDVQLLLFFC